MKYLGIFSEGYFYTSDKSNYGKLFGYLEDNIELIILYDKNLPFLMKEVGVFLDKTEPGDVKWYNVWEYEHLSENDAECIAVAKYFVTETIEFLKSTLQHFKETGKIIERPIS